MGTLAFVLWICSTPALAEAEVDLTRMANLSVVLRDEDGQPVASARVMPYAMRVIEQPGHGYWNRELLGPPETVVSGNDGKAVIRYPVQVGSGPRVLTTRLVTFSGKHTDFVSTVVHFDLGPEQAEVTLKPGCDVRLTAVDTGRHEVRDFGVMVAGPFGPDYWALDEFGGRRSRSLSDGTWQTMLVKLQGNGPTLFSDVFPLRIRPRQTVRVRNIELRPGAKVRGLVSEDVPRPVRGYVVAASVPRPANDHWVRDNPSLVWHEWLQIDKDGRFQFDSVPRGGDLQLIAICDGWISTTTVREARGAVMGQIFPVEEDELTVTVDMERTGTVRIHVVAGEGKPFTEGRVASWPNQRWWKGGSTLLGQRARSADNIRNQLLPFEQRIEPQNNSLPLPFNRELSSDGTATLTGLPLGHNLGLVLQHDQFKFSTDNREGRLRVKLESPEIVNLEATVRTAE
jgi:hypothetical protein